jgi:hypothetical protein
MQNDKVSIKFGSATVLITALLCILKVTGYLSIPWLWCFCLLWLPFALVFGVIGLILVCAIIYIIVILITELITK